MGGGSGSFGFTPLSRNAASSVSQLDFGSLAIGTGGEGGSGTTGAGGDRRRSRVEAEPAVPAAAPQNAGMQQKIDESVRMCKAAVEGDYDPAGHLTAVQAVRRVLAVETNPPIPQVIATGIVQHLVACLHDVQAVTVEVKFEAAWALTNITSGTSEQTAYVVRCGGLAAMLFAAQRAAGEGPSSGNLSLIEQVVWAVGNIAGDGAALRDLVLNQPGAVQLLLQITSAAVNNGSFGVNVTLLNNCVWTLSNLVRNKPKPPAQLVAGVVAFFQQFVAMFRSASDAASPLIDATADALWGLSYATDGMTDFHVDTCRTVLPVTMMILSSDAKDTLRTPALRTMGNLATGDDRVAQMVVDTGAVPVLIRMFQNQREKKGLRKVAAWTLSNITAGSAAQISACLGHGLLEAIGSAHASPFDLKKELTWCVANAIAGSPAAVAATVYERVAQSGCVALLVDMVKADNEAVSSEASKALCTMLAFAGNGQPLTRSASPAYARQILEALVPYRDTLIMRALPSQTTLVEYVSAYMSSS